MLDKPLHTPGLPPQIVYLQNSCNKGRVPPQPHWASASHCSASCLCLAQSTRCRLLLLPPSECRSPQSLLPGPIAEPIPYSTYAHAGPTCPVLPQQGTMVTPSDTCPLCHLASPSNSIPQGPPLGWMLTVRIRPLPFDGMMALVWEWPVVLE